MNLNSARVKIEDSRYGYRQHNYVNSPITREETSVIEGSFYQARPMTIREMITRKINKSLCFCLGLAISVTFISYYIAMNYEAKLNNLDNEIVKLNAENQDLQAELDRFKSFNNVDSRIEQYNLLQKADKVIEVTALATAPHHETSVEKTASNKFNWTIGY